MFARWCRPLAGAIGWSVPLELTRLSSLEVFGQSFVRSPDMSGVSSTEEYHPGLEGVIASETAIANIEGTDGAGGLEYRGYRIEDLAGHVSYEETAFLLLHGDLPNQPAVARVRRPAPRSRAIPEPLIALYRQIPRRRPSHGRAAQLGERAGSFRPRRQRPADRPCRQRPQGRAAGRPDGDGRRLPRADRQGLARRSSPATISITPPIS